MAVSPKFGIGDAVFAKMKGYPAWPAKVEGVADGTPNKIKYHVYFYGTKQIAVCRQEELCPYLENRNVLGKSKKYRGFNAAIDEMDSELRLGLTAGVPVHNVSESRRAMNEIELACCEVLTARFQDFNSREDPKLRNSGGMSTQDLESVVPTPIALSSTGNQQGLASRKRRYEETLNFGLSTERAPSANPEISHVGCASGIQNQPIETSNSPTLLSSLKKEIKLLDINLGIQNSLSLNFADPEACLKYLDDLFAMEVSPLMLKKHPEIVDTLFKVQNYVGNVKHWKLSECEVESFTSKAKSIQVKSKLIYDKYQSMFEFPYRKTFLQYFAEEVTKFRERTSGMTADSFYLLIREPEENV